MEVIIPSCQAKQVQFMDAMQWMHHVRFKDLTNKIHKQNRIGKVKRVNASFSVPCLDDKNIRNNPGIYYVCFFVFFFSIFVFFFLRVVFVYNNIF